MLERATDVSVSSLVNELRLAAWQADKEAFPSMATVLAQWCSQLELLGGDAPRATRALNDAVRGAASALDVWHAVREW
ncbi:MAG: hypothetical protein JWM53_1125 [bacterium]|nr:hypothetical protein [bacterium]